MSMIPTPGVIGILQSSAPGSAETMTIDSAYAAYLQALLVDGGWTYVRTRVENSVEVIKITGIGGQVITVTRAEDNTTALGLAAGAELEFVVAASAVADLIAAAAMAPAITITGAGSVTVTEPSSNNYVISAPVPALSSEDGSITVTSAGPSEFDLAVNASTIGCCSST